MRVGAASALIGLVASGTVMAATLNNPATRPNEFSICRAMKDGGARLKCYDALPLQPTPGDVISAPVDQATEDKLVAKWAGASNMGTRPFHVGGPWELQWNTGKGYFSATLHRLSGSGSKVDLLANGMEGGSSSSYQPNGGNFYIEFSAAQPWSARVVSVPTSAKSQAAKDEEEPLIEVEGDQTDLPPCDGPEAATELKKLIENSPLGQTMHFSVLRVGSVKSHPIRGGMSICTATVMTNGGEVPYSFQNYRKDGEIFVIGRPSEGQ